VAICEKANSGLFHMPCIAIGLGYSLATWEWAV